MPWMTIKDIADKSLAKKGLAQRMSDRQILTTVNDSMLELFGYENRNKARAIYFKNNVLTIVVLNNSLFLEIESQVEQFVNILNEQLKPDLIEKIKFMH